MVGLVRRQILEEVVVGALERWVRLVVQTEETEEMALLPLSQGHL
jgi:hypothetical protein